MKWHGVAVAGAITLTAHGSKRPMPRHAMAASGLSCNGHNANDTVLDIARALQLADGADAVRPSQRGQHVYVLLGAASSDVLLDGSSGSAVSPNQSVQTQAPARKVYRRRISHRETRRHDGPAVPDFRQRPMIAGFTDRTHYLAMVAGTAILQLRTPMLRKEQGLSALMPVARLKEEWPCTGRFCHRSGKPHCDRVRCRQLQALLTDSE